MGSIWGRHESPPMTELLARAEAIETRGEALVISICAGFPLADIYDVGPSVTVRTDGRDPRPQATAEGFIDHA
jgi:microcystin degradation protein MlrC